MRHNLLVVSVFPCLFLPGCSTNSAPAAPGRPPAPVVTTAPVVARTVPVDIRVIGNVEPYTTIAVKAQIGGQLIKVYFHEGDDVKKGDLLFLIDPRPYDEAIRQVEANLARDTALLRQAEANLQRDIAQEKYAREQAARYEKLFKDGILSKQQADQILTDADVRVEAVRADRAAIESAQAAIQADQAVLANAKLQRSYCLIAAPVDGRTGDLAVKEGNLVKASDTQLVTINQIQPIYVAFSAPEAKLPEIKKHMAVGKLAVFASPPDNPSPTEKGVLTFINNEVDKTTGTIKLKGTFANENGELWPGQFVKVALRLATIPSALLIPIQSLQTSQSGDFVYVVMKDMTVAMRPVVAGMRVDQEVVVEKGLKLGETVVKEGQLRLAPGMKVRIKEARPS